MPKYDDLTTYQQEEYKARLRKFWVFLPLTVGCLAGLIYYIYWFETKTKSKKVNAIIEEILSGEIVTTGEKCIEQSESSDGAVDQVRTSQLSEEELHGSSGWCKKWEDRSKFKIQLKVKVDNLAGSQVTTHTVPTYEGLPKVGNTIPVHVKDGVVLEKAVSGSQLHGLGFACVAILLIMFFGLTYVNA